MAALSIDTVTQLLTPYLGEAVVPADLYLQLSAYLDLLLKWNARTNLTAIRTAEEIVRRHFGESLFTARHLPPASTLLDFGSGAGFPGLPIQLMRPQLAVTLAESQNKKATFLREAVRTLGLSTEVWPARVEAMPPARRFGLVTLRAVDAMHLALAEASTRAQSAVLVLATERQALVPPTGFEWQPAISMPGTDSQQIWIAGRR